MRLTKRKAIEISIELWEWLAKTGKQKSEWDGWNKYGHMWNSCALCEYRDQFKPRGYGLCPTCPYYKMYGCCYTMGEKPATPYDKWEIAKTAEAHKKYAKLFLTQLREL